MHIRLPFRVMLFALALALVPAPPCAAQQNGAAGPAKYLFDATNRERTSRGIPALVWDNTLAATALEHAKLMARQNALSHQFPGEPALGARATKNGVRYTSLAENIAYGPTTSTIHTGWMNSPPHRASILNANLTSLGVAVVQEGGLFYAVEDFSRTFQQLTLEEQETLLGEDLSALGLRVVNQTEDARKACLSADWPGGNPQPRTIEKYETTELSTVPAQLRNMIHDGHFTSAAVGACVPQQNSIANGYRLAILFY
jgi:hypothetical protein